MAMSLSVDAPLKAQKGIGMMVWLSCLKVTSQLNRSPHQLVFP